MSEQKLAGGGVDGNELSQIIETLFQMVRADPRPSDQVIGGVCGADGSCEQELALAALVQKYALYLDGPQLSELLRLTQQLHPETLAPTSGSVGKQPRMPAKTRMVWGVIGHRMDTFQMPATSLLSLIKDYTPKHERHTYLLTGLLQYMATGHLSIHECLQLAKVPTAPRLALFQQLSDWWDHGVPQKLVRHGRVAVFCNDDTQKALTENAGGDKGEVRLPLRMSWGEHTRFTQLGWSLFREGKIGPGTIEKLIMSGRGASRDLVREATRSCFYLQCAPFAEPASAALKATCRESTVHAGVSSVRGAHTLDVCTAEPSERAMNDHHTCILCGETGFSGARYECDTCVPVQVEKASRAEIGARGLDPNNADRLCVGGGSICHRCHLRQAHTESHPPSHTVRCVSTVYRFVQTHKGSLGSPLSRPSSYADDSSRLADIVYCLDVFLSRRAAVWFARGGDAGLQVVWHSVSGSVAEAGGLPTGWVAGVFCAVHPYTSWHFVDYLDPSRPVCNVTAPLPCSFESAVTAVATTTTTATTTAGSSANRLRLAHQLPVEQSSSLTEGFVTSPTQLKAQQAALERDSYWQRYHGGQKPPAQRTTVINERSSSTVAHTSRPAPLPLGGTGTSEEDDNPRALTASRQSTSSVSGIWAAALPDVGDELKMQNVPISNAMGEVSDTDSMPPGRAMRASDSEFVSIPPPPPPPPADTLPNEHHTHTHTLTLDQPLCVCKDAELLMAPVRHFRLQIRFMRFPEQAVHRLRVGRMRHIANRRQSMLEAARKCVACRMRREAAAVLRSRNLRTHAHSHHASPAHTSPGRSARLVRQIGQISQPTAPKTTQSPHQSLTESPLRLRLSSRRRHRRSRSSRSRGRSETPSTDSSLSSFSSEDSDQGSSRRRRSKRKGSSRRTRSQRLEDRQEAGPSVGPVHMGSPEVVYDLSNSGPRPTFHPDDEHTTVAGAQEPQARDIFIRRGGGVAVRAPTAHSSRSDASELGRPSGSFRHTPSRFPSGTSSDEPLTLRSHRMSTRSHSPAGRQYGNGSPGGNGGEQVDEGWATTRHPAVAVAPTEPRLLSDRRTETPVASSRDDETFVVRPAPAQEQQTAPEPRASRPGLSTLLQRVGGRTERSDSRAGSRARSRGTTLHQQTLLGTKFSFAGSPRAGTAVRRVEQQPSQEDSLQLSDRFGSSREHETPARRSSSRAASRNHVMFSLGEKPAEDSTAAAGDSGLNAQSRMRRLRSRHRQAYQFKTGRRRQFFRGKPSSERSESTENDKQWTVVYR